MKVLQDQIKSSSLLYKIGNLTNISKISLQTQWLLLREEGKKNEKKEEKKIDFSLRPAVTKCCLHLLFIFN